MEGYNSEIIDNSSTEDDFFKSFTENTQSVDNELRELFWKSSNNWKINDYVFWLIIFVFVVSLYFVLRCVIKYLIYWNKKIDFDLNEKLWYRMFNVFYALVWIIVLALGYVIIFK